MNRKCIRVAKTNNYKGLCIRHTFVKSYIFKVFIGIFYFLPIILKTRQRSLTIRSLLSSYLSYCLSASFMVFISVFSSTPAGQSSLSGLTFYSNVFRSTRVPPSISTHLSLFNCSHTLQALGLYTFS